MLASKNKLSLYNYLNESDDELPVHNWITLSQAGKITYGQRIIDLVNIAYAVTPLGSFIKNQNDVNASNWRIFSDDGHQINCVIFYRSSRPNESWRGFKIQGIGHDGQPENKKQVMMEHGKLLTHPGWWSESRGAVAKVLLRIGSHVIKDEEFARKIFPGTDLVMIGDDGKYERYINGPGSHKADEYMFGFPILKENNKHNISEYIQILEAREDWDSVKYIIPDGVLLPSTHADLRANARYVPKELISSDVKNALLSIKYKIRDMEPGETCAFVTHALDLGVIKSKTPNSYGRYLYTVKTVRSNLHKKQDYREIIAPGAINKIRSYDNDVITLKADNKFYSYRLADLEKLTHGLNPIQERANRLYQSAKEFIKLNPFDTDEQELQSINTAGYTNLVYVVNGDQDYVAYNPFTVIRIFNRYADHGYVNVINIPIDDIAMFNMAGNIKQSDHFSDNVQSVKALKEFFENSERNAI